MKSHQLRSLGLTLLIHGIIAVLLLFLYISSPIPPWEEGLAGGGGGGSFVEFGELEFNDVPETAAMEKTSASEPENEEEFITSDLEETVAVVSPEKNKEKPKEKPKKPEKAKETKPVIKEPEMPKVAERKADPRSLYQGKKNTGGAPNGSQPGSGSGGQGTGSGGGIGDGTGSGSGGGSGTGSGGGNGPGVGVGFDLAGRDMRSKPRVEDNSQEQGRIVIEVLVDKNGVVLRADGPARGTTLSNGTLLRKCKEASMKARFSPSPAGVEEQRGTITYNFILR
ncbi:MAG: hypothetical protein LW707_05910 [Sphingobacteriales bacterium]|nr:hypothetical protein [Sphingobacteriales bacterium]